MIAASPFAVADRFKENPARNREQRKVSDSAADFAEHPCSRGLGTTWTGVTVMADAEMRAILGLA
ncbi:hypothetical protein [Mycobacterium arosiense]|uniref:hypothetical protein n=1 Tax=Mycobacterium arosiense TaxID=425468 RepID=UPI001FE4F10F|nr:hypothetical protein [Mycobacterium arosiense]